MPISVRQLTIGVGQLTDGCQREMNHESASTMHGLRTFLLIAEHVR